MFLQDQQSVNLRRCARALCVACLLHDRFLNAKRELLTVSPLLVLRKDKLVFIAQPIAFLSQGPQQRRLLAVAAHFQCPLPPMPYQLSRQGVELSTQSLHCIEALVFMQQFGIHERDQVIDQHARF